jgi:alpha-tubulin suppressor-like RCC1 family protein
LTKISAAHSQPIVSLGLSKFEMTEILAQDIRLEKEVLGEKGQQQLCDMEREIVDLIRRNEIKQADYLRLKFVEKWSSLSKEQKLRANIDDQRKEDEQRSNRDRQEKDYKDWNAKRTGLERASVTEHSGLMAGAITTRGADIQTPRGESQFLNIEAGAHHAAIIVQDERSRSLYTWGVSSLGRLGHGESEFEDCNYPRIVEELKGTSIIEISCGHSHSAAVSKNGHLFMWGSASSGELGFGGEISDYFCTAPTRLLIPCCTVVKVSCGAAHTACIGKSGEMYVWGSCDGGRLGLGRDQIGTRYTPTVVNSLRHEKIVDVSCGTFVSLALTESENVGTHGRTSVKRMTGGRLYVAGPKNVLGASFPSFGELECMRTKPAVIKSIAAGYSHQAFVSQSGELYCWGHNIHGCCGQPETATFISEPALVER